MVILWVEDRPDYVKYNLRLLEKDGHKVYVKSTAESALDTISSAKSTEPAYELMILDIMLPKGEGTRMPEDARPELMGIELLRQMAQRRVIVPTVAVSAVADEGVRAQIRTEFAFVADVLKKPVKLEELREAIASAGGGGTGDKEQAK